MYWLQFGVTSQFCLHDRGIATHQFEFKELVRLVVWRRSPKFYGKSGGRVQPPKILQSGCSPLPQMERLLRCRPPFSLLLLTPPNMKYDLPAPSPPSVSGHF